jgi:Flp pilus assembly protein CpaB
MVRLRRPRSIPHLVRRVLATVLAVAALVLAVRPLPAPVASATGAAEVPVVIANADLAAGAVLAPDHLAVGRWPARLVPAGAVEFPDELTGRTLAGALRRGEAVTDARLVGPGLTRSLPHGQVAAPVRLADLAVAELVRPGDRVDVLATASDSADAEVVVAGALVLAPSSRTEHDSTDPAAGTGLLLLAVDAGTAARLAAAAASDTLSVTLAPP